MPKKIFLLGIIFFGTLLGSPVPSSAQTAPPSPTLNNATAGNRQVTLDWTPTATANGYKVKYGTTTASYPNIIDVGNATNFIVNSLANSTTYFFVVTAYNAGGESGPSNELSAQPVQVTAVYSNDLCNNGISSASSCHQGCASIYSHTRAFDNIFNVPEAWVTAGTQTGWLQYTFASPEKINKYTINPRAAQIYDPRDWTFEAYDAANSQWIVLDTRVNQAWTYQVSNEYTFSNANAYTSYRLNISANGGHVDVGLVEMEMMQLITAGAPLAITNLQVQTNNASVGLIWSEPNNGGSPITSYQIQYGTVASGAFHSTYIDDNVPGATINGLINNTAYQFRVVAVNALSNSDPSNTVIGMPGSTVSGSINANTTWTLSASPYIVIGDVTVVPGVTLTIQPGVEVRFAGNYSLTVNGTLNAAGTSSQRIKFTSHQVNPAKGDWNRIAINNGTSVLNYLQVEYADSGIYVSPQIPPTVTIQNSIFQNNRKGIYVDWESTVAINDNTITNNDDGIYVECFNSGCTPRINHNSIYNNANYNLRTSNLGGLNFSWVTIDAENNWWGTTDPQVIMGTILDFSDNGSLPTVDFVPFLDAPNGNPIVSNYLFGAINSNTTWTTAQSPYIAIANVTVGSGVTLTIQPGVEVRFAGNYSLVVDGILNAVGSKN